MSEKIPQGHEQSPDSENSDLKSEGVAQNPDMEDGQSAEQASVPDLKPVDTRQAWEILEEKRAWDSIASAVDALSQVSFEVNRAVELERVKNMSIAEAWAHVIHLNRTAEKHDGWLPRETEKILKAIPLGISVDGDGRIFGFIG